MKECSKCGEMMDDNLDTCPHCNTKQGEALAEKPDVLETKDEIGLVGRPAGDISTTEDGPNFIKKPFPVKIVIAMGLAVLLIIVVAVALCSRSGERRQSQSAFFQSIEATQEAIEDELEQAKVETGLAAFLKNIDKKGLSSDVTFSISAGSLGLEGLSARLMSQQNAVGNQVYVEGSVGLFGMTYQVLEYSMNKNLLVFASPLLFTGAYSLDLDRLEQDLPDSALGTMMGIDKESAKAIAEYCRTSLSLSQNHYALDKKTEKELERAWADFESSLTFSSTGNETVPINGMEQDCEKINVEVPNEAMLTYLNTCIDAMAKDQTIISLLNLNAISSTQNQDFETMVAEMKSSLEDAFAEIQSITMTGYVKDGLMLRLDTSLTSQKNDAFSLTFEFGGEKNLTDALTITAKEGDNHVILAWKGNVIPIDGVVQGQLLVSASEDTASAGLDLYWAPLQETNNFSLSCNVVEETVFSMKGNLAVSDTQFVMNPMTFTVSDSIGGGLVTVDLEAFPTEKIGSISVKPTNLLTMDEEALQNLITEIQSSIYGLVFSF